MTLRRLDHALVLTDDLEATSGVLLRRARIRARASDRRCRFPGFWLYLDGGACLHVADRAAYEAHAASVGLAATGASIDHVAFAAEGYDGVAARLEAAGVDAVTNDVPDAAMRQIFLSDPNGVRIELNVT